MALTECSHRAAQCVPRARAWKLSAALAHASKRDDNQFVAEKRALGLASAAPQPAQGEQALLSEGYRCDTTSRHLQRWKCGQLKLGGALRLAKWSKTTPLREIEAACVLKSTEHGYTTGRDALDSKDALPRRSHYQPCRIDATVSTTRPRMAAARQVGRRSTRLTTLRQPRGIRRVRSCRVRAQRNGQRVRIGRHTRRPPPTALLLARSGSSEQWDEDEEPLASVHTVHKAVDAFPQQRLIDGVSAQITPTARRAKTPTSSTARTWARTRSSRSGEIGKSVVVVTGRVDGVEAVHSSRRQRSDQLKNKY